MEEIKNALNRLEQAVLKLETGVHQSKKSQTQSVERVIELKGVIKTAYDRLDKALSAFHQGGE